MTAHLHATYVEGCFRCDLSRDEVRAPLACPAHPSTDLVHLDGECRCFYGGPAPQHAASRPAGEWAALGEPGDVYASRRPLPTAETRPLRPVARDESSTDTRESA